MEIKKNWKLNDTVMPEDLNRIESNIEQLENTQPDENFSTADKQKLHNIEAGAQVNKIEVVKVNNSPVSVSNKAVNISVPAATVVSNSLNNSSTTEALSAAQGKELKLLVDRRVTKDKLDEQIGIVFNHTRDVKAALEGQITKEKQARQSADAELQNISREIKIKFENVIEHSSYLIFCANINTDSLDAAFGKNNENEIHNIGKQLVMYSKFKGRGYGLDKLIKCDTLRDICNDIGAIKEVLKDPEIKKLIFASPYAKSQFTADDTALRILNSFTDTPKKSLSEIWTNSKYMSDLYRNWYAIDKLEIMHWKGVEASALSAPNIKIESGSLRIRDREVIYAGACYVVFAQYSDYTDGFGYKPDGTTRIFKNTFANRIEQQDMGSSKSAYPYTVKYIPITLVN